MPIVAALTHFTSPFKFLSMLDRRTVAQTPSQLDLPPPKRWRRLVPPWLRSLIWVDAVARYDAFLSYSWASDSEVAPVIQSVLQRFLCPWYRLRAKTIFRDLSSLPAGSSLENELFARLDRSVHLIVLACPAAAQSRGMEMEARHWFSRHRDGQILIIVTAGECDTWQKIREHLLPPAIRDNLAGAALWASIRHHRDAILENPNSHKLRGELIEDLRQIFLRFYPMSDWGTIARCGACPAATRCRTLVGTCVALSGACFGDCRVRQVRAQA